MGSFTSIYRYSLICLMVSLGASSACGGDLKLKDGALSPPVGGPALQRDEKPKLDLFYVNGQRTDAENALQQAKATGDILRCPCRLIYHDGTLPIVDDIAIAWDKMFNADVSLNAATGTLIAEIRAHIETGKDIFIVSFSGGTIIANNAVRSVAEGYDDLSEDDRNQRLEHIHIVTVGSAVFDDDNIFADCWPGGIGSRFDLFDVRDGVAQFAGPADWDDDLDEAHWYLENYVARLDWHMLATSGREVVGREACDKVRLQIRCTRHRNSSKQ